MCQSDDRATLLNETDQRTEALDYIPTDALSLDAYHHVRQHLHPSILNHSLRVWLYAKALSERDDAAWHQPANVPVLFTACMFHDMGTADACDGEYRFEIEGADAARTFLESHGVSSVDAREVWIAIAVHTSPQIGERISSLGRIIRLAPHIDFEVPEARARISHSIIERAERLLPRLDPAKVLGDLVAEQGLRNPNRAPWVSWPGALVRSKLENPDWEGVNKAF